MVASLRVNADPTWSDAAPFCPENIATVMPSNWRPLHDAVQSGDLDTVRDLLQAGTDPNLFDDLGKTPLHYAVELEDVALIALLLAAGADVNAHHEATIGNTPLRQVAERCSLAVAQVLIEAGADPTIKGWMGLSALDKAGGRQRGDGPAVHKLLAEAAKKRM